MPLIGLFISGMVAQMSKLAAFTAFLIAVIFIFFASLWIFGSDLFYYFMGLIFDFFSYLLESIGLDPTMFDFMSALRKLPPSILEIAEYVGFSTCMRITLSAIVINLTIKLIPFLRF